MRRGIGKTVLLTLILITAESVSILTGAIRVIGSIDEDFSRYKWSSVRDNVVSISDIWKSLFAETKKEEDITNGFESTITYIEVPDLVGKDYIGAEKLVQGLGLVFKMDRQHSDYYEEGTIMGQKPEPGTSIKRGETITALISAGEKPPSVIQIPDVVGLTLEDTRVLLSQKGLAVGKISFDNSDYPEGYVINQSAPEGNYTTEGYALDLVVSNGVNTDNAYSQSEEQTPYYEDTWLCERSCDYYEKYHGIRPPCVRIDSYDGDIVIIHLYEAMSDHDATWDWYYVDRNTGETTNFMGESFNIFTD